MKLRIAVSLAVLALSVAAGAQTPSPAEVPEWMRDEMTLCDALNGGLGTDDWDRDGIKNCDDNCIFDANKDQKDRDKNGTGDKCEWRKRADAEWEKVGRKQRETATEPVDLEELVRRSTNILVVRFAGAAAPEDNFSLSKHHRAVIVGSLKGEVLPLLPTLHKGIWIWIPDGSARDLYGERDLLVFLKDGKVRRWKEPHVYTAMSVDGKPYIETHYIGYDLADRGNAILGVSESRLNRLKAIIGGNKKVR